MQTFRKTRSDNSFDIAVTRLNTRKSLVYPKHAVADWSLFVLLLASFVVLGISIEPTISLALDPEEERPSFLQNSSERKLGRHERVKNGINVNVEQAEAIYQAHKVTLSTGYKQKDELQYLSWKRANILPYPSFSHGRRFLNNYLNKIANSYLNYESAGHLPKGSIIAKDSFYIDDTGQFINGPLFLMEKMQAGFNAVSGDWRYSLIEPTGKLIGQTNGANSEQVRFCISCHIAAEKTDHLFFIPRPYRLKPPP